MKLSAEQLKQFDRDGYLFFPSLFTLAEIKVLTAEVPALYAQRRPENVREKTGDVVRTNFAAHLYSYPFAKLARHPRMVEPVKQVYGDDELPAVGHQPRHDPQARRARRHRRAERAGGLDDPFPRLPGARLDF